MGVDCKIYLPIDVTDSELADAVGILMGMPKKFAQHKDYVSCDVEGVSTKPTHTPGMGDLIVNGLGRKLVDGETAHHVYFHYAARFRKQCWIMVHPPSTPIWIAVGKRLVQWFGGYVMYMDCDGDKRGNIYQRKRTCPVDRSGFIPDDGTAWTTYQKAVSELEAVTPKELAEAWKLAAYKDHYHPTGLPKDGRGD